MYKRQIEVSSSAFFKQIRVEPFVDFGALDVVMIMEPLEAVSYTHLRAHETVLDLVCRLLLEKKKNHVKTTSSTHRTHTA